MICLRSRSTSWSSVDSRCLRLVKTMRGLADVAIDCGLAVLMIIWDLAHTF